MRGVGTLARDVADLHGTYRDVPGEQMMSKHSKREKHYRRNALATALALGLGLTGVAYAQSTTGSVYGTAPVSAGETVRIVNNQTGQTREVGVDSTGRYSAGNLPVGTYSVSLMQDGSVVASKDDVAVSVNGGAQVPFSSTSAGKAVQNLASVTVTANSMPAIDVSSTRQTSVITAQDLKQLPVARSAESIALLAPGTATGNSGLGTGPAGTPLISFGGDSVVENAYYINGFNTTDPVGNAGGLALPYFAIAEQQTITSGYSAEFGRSTGGVISQVGHRGGNDFHAGLYVTWMPAWAQGNYDNRYYANPNSNIPNQEYGDLFQNRSKSKNWTRIYDAYVSGPLIKDKLFFYITAEAEHDNSAGAGSTPPTQSTYTSTGSTLPKFYGKLDWNINDNNTLEFTHIQTKNIQNYDNIYGYNYANNSIGAFQSVSNPVYSSKFDVNILKFTSYITDNITLSVLGGKMKSTYFSQLLPYAGFNPDLPGVNSATGGAGSGAVLDQDPTVPGYGGFNNNASTLPTSGHKSTNNNFRVDLNWKLGAHDLRFGIDNQRSTDVDDGSISAGPGYYWVYGQQSNLTSPNLLCNGLGQCVGSAVTAANPNGYYANKVVYGGAASFTVMQKAQYIEDNWQVLPNLLLNIGLRNDQFTNYNPDMVAYVRQTKPQWAPRLSFSWDIFGDSSAKLYGNAGRYYLALPSGLGVRMAGANAYIDTYYTYSSIDPTGIPQGLTQLPATVPVFSADGELGVPKNPKIIAAADLKPMYQDEYVLGFQKALNAFGQSLVWTSQATYSKMNDVVDDTGAVVPGVNLPADADPDAISTEADILVNPGRSNTMRYIASDGSLKTYQWNPHTAPGQVMVGFPAAFRKYYALEESLEHPWDGKWMGKIDYVFSKSYGTTEGPTDSAVGQITSASGAAGGHQSGTITEAWDFPELMQYSNGEQANSHRHTFKAYGTYAITPEWLVSGTYIIQSGVPIVCLGYFGTDESDPVGYASIQAGAYHWCGGHPSRPGDAGHSPWTHQLNLGVSYIPDWANKHLTLQVQVHNVFNEQKGTSVVNNYGSTQSPAGTYLLPIGLETPRYGEFSVRYDF